MFARSILLATLLAWIPGPGPAPSPPARIAVLSIALNDLANQPAVPELPGRLRLLAEAIREHLGAECSTTAEARRCSPKAS